MNDNKYIYGLQTIAMILDQDPKLILKLYVNSSTQNKRIAGLIDKASKLGISTEKILDFSKYAIKSHQPLVAECRAFPNLDESVLNEIVEKNEAVTLVILDGITDPHNLGAILRSCAAMNVTAVVIPKNNAVGLTPTVRNIACGGAEIVPFIRVSNLARTLKNLKKQGLWLYGAAVGTGSELNSVVFPKKIGLVFGGEHAGLKRLTQENCDEVVKINLANNMDSLNVSVAAGIFIYAAQQR